MSRGGHSRIYLYPRRYSLKAARSAPEQRHLVRFGATAPVRASRAECPLPVRSRDLRREAGQRARRADSSRSQRQEETGIFRSNAQVFGFDQPLIIAAFLLQIGLRAPPIATA